jgi:hypothetical protein
LAGGRAPQVPRCAGNNGLTSEKSVQSPQLLNLLARSRWFGRQSRARVRRVLYFRFLEGQMNFRRALMVSFLFLFLGGLMAEPNAEVRETADRLAGSVYIGPSMHTLRELTDGFGGRLSDRPRTIMRRSGRRQSFAATGSRTSGSSRSRWRMGGRGEQRMARC